MDFPLEHHRVSTNGVTLHVVAAGPRDGPLVILLHGFPEFWYGWRKQIPHLASRGYRVWAPDQRGYNLSDKPGAVSAYRLGELAADVVGLIDAAGRDRAVLVGHDWGGGIAWWVARKFASRLERLVILNVPEGRVLLDALRRSPRQLRKSWYMFFFQIPWLPEWSARAGNWRNVVRALETTSRPGTFTAADLECYRESWSQPGAYRSMIHWYRAAFRSRRSFAAAAAFRHDPADAEIEVPTLLIWGVHDRFLGRELARPSIAKCADGRLVFLDATHWVQHEESERVNELLSGFLSDLGPCPES